MRLKLRYAILEFIMTLAEFLDKHKEGALPRIKVEGARLSIQRSFFNNKDLTILGANWLSEHGEFLTVSSTGEFLYRISEDKLKALLGNSLVTIVK